jgi:hypothetical protein
VAYRDWVINALNDDMPFDEFTIEQIAGDMLPNATQAQKVATGFHRNTMTNTEGGTDDEEFRYEALIDRVNTTWAGVDGQHVQLCAVPQPQIRSIHDERVLPVHGVPESHRRTATRTMSARRSRCSSPVKKSAWKSSRTRPQSRRRGSRKQQHNLKSAAAQSDWEQKTAAALTNWQVIDPSEFISLGGATLTKTATKALLASGENPSNDTYMVVAPAASGRLTGVRLEVLESGAEKTLGRSTNGGFVLRSFQLAVKSDDATRPLKFKSATADASQRDFDVSNLLNGQRRWLGRADFGPT